LGTRTGESILGVVGGIIGILAGALAFYMATLGPNGMIAESLGVIAAFMGILGFIGGVIVGSFKYPGGVLMLIAGIAGFFAISLIWLVPGTLLIIGGILTFKKPRAMQVHV
jgi:hypothetical protein